VKAREFTNREGTRSRSHLSRQNRHSAASGQAGRAAGASRLGAGGRCWALLGAGGRCWALLGARVRQGTSAGDTGAGRGRAGAESIGRWRLVRATARGRGKRGRAALLGVWAPGLLAATDLLLGWASAADDGAAGAIWLGCSTGLLGWVAWLAGTAR